MTELTKKESEMLEQASTQERIDPIRSLDTHGLRAEVQRVRGYLDAALESRTGDDDVASARVALRQLLEECRRRGVAP